MTSDRRTFHPSGLAPERQHEIVRLLDSGDRGTLLAWAQDTGSSWELLRALAQLPDPAIQRAVALNPSTHPADLMQLGRIHPEEFLQNKAFLFEECFGSPFPQDEKAHIERLAEYRKVIRKESAFLELPRCEREELARNMAKTVWADYLSRDPDEVVRMELAGNLDKTVSPEVRRRMLADPSSSVRAALARNTHLDAGTYESLASDPDLKVRRVLAGNPARLCGQAHFRLLDQGEEEILMELARNQSIGYPLTIRLAGTGLRIRCELASNPKIDHETVDTLIRHDERPVRLRLAANTGVIEATICQIHCMDDAELMEAIVSNPKCPHLYLSSLAHRGDEQVHLALLRREELPALVQLHIAREGSPRARKALLKRITSGKHQHNSPALRKVCETLATDNEADLRLGILSDSRLGPHFLLERLAGASIEEKRRLAANQSMPLEQLTNLCLERDKMVSHNAMRTLLWHSSRISRAVAASRDRSAITQYQQIEQFLTGHMDQLSEAQRLLLLGHRDTPAGVLGHFSCSGDPRVWDALLLRNFRYPFHLLTEPGETNGIVVSTIKKRTSPETVLAHVNSTNPYYRGWAARNLKLPGELQARLRADPSPYVQHVMKTKHTHEGPDTD